MNDTIAAPAERHINWGGVLKGVAIVTGVVVAAVVGAWILGTIAGYAMGGLTASQGLSALASGASGAIEYGAGFVSYIGQTIGSMIAGIPSGIAGILGLSGQQFVQGAAVQSLAGPLGATAGALVVAPAAVHALQNTHFVDASPTMHADAGVLSTTLPMHDIGHMTHHAAEHASEHAGIAWSEKFAPRAAAYGSFADTVRAQKQEPKIAQPSASFTEQLNTDRANLDAALSK